MKRDRRKGAREKSDRTVVRRSPSVHLWAVGGLLAFTLAVYSNSFHGGLAADAAALLHDPRLANAGISNIASLFHQQYWASGASGLYRPLATLSYVFNYAMLGNGLNPEGYHALNFLLHAANMLLVYLLGILLLGRTGPALLLAGIWGAHPVLTESVTNIAGRPDLLAGFGVLAGLVAHMMAGRAQGRARLAWLAALAAAFTIGIFSKENAVVLIALMGVYDVLWRPRQLRHAAAAYAAVLLPLTVFLLLRHGALAGAPPMYVLFTDNPLTGVDFWTARLTAAKVLAKDVALLFWPGVLSCDYSYNSIPLFDWGLDWIPVAALAVVMAGAVLFWWRKARRDGSAPALGFFLMFFVIAIAPTSNFLLRIGTIMAERFLYLAAIAFAGCVAIAAHLLAESVGPGRRIFVTSAALALCCGYGVRTYVRNFDWSSERSLWESTVRAVPQNAKAHITLADILMDPAGRDLPRAAREADYTIAIVKGLPDSRNVAVDFATAGRAYRLMGESETDPSRRQPWFRKAFDVLQRGRQIDAAATDAIRRGPGGQFYALLGEPEVYAELGRIYPHLGEPAKAAEALAHARQIRPGSPDDGDSAALAGVYDSMGEWRKAAVTLIEGQTINPANPGFLKAALGLYAQHDPQGCESQPGAGAPQLNLACPAVQQDLCSALKNVAALRRARGENKLSELTARSAREQFACR
jgi:tetratricopeptide (TPR) repeat protein